MALLGESMVNRILAVAAFAVLAGAKLNIAKSDEAPASSAPACDFYRQHKLSMLSTQENAANAALFAKLCSESAGLVIPDNVSGEMEHRITQPGKWIMRPLQDFYPDGAIRLRQQGTTWVTLIVETDGRVSSVNVVKSSGVRSLDDAAVKWASALTAESPAYLDFTPVRLYILQRVTFQLR